MSALQSLQALSLPQLQIVFLDLRPRILAHAQVVFRGTQCPHRRADRIAEVEALCWLWFCRLVRCGKDPRSFVSALATYAARAVCCGRRLGGGLTSKDVLSERAQQLHGFKVEGLPTSTRAGHDTLYGTVAGQLEQDVYEERLTNNLQTPVPEQVCFRLDFRTWLQSRSVRDRRIVRDMAQNASTGDLARKYRVTASRISQLRRDYHRDWQRFCADPADSVSGPSTIVESAHDYSS